jgi:16S rRNA (guanine527-N7)-methyltransferase
VDLAGGLAALRGQGIRVPDAAGDRLAEYVALLQKWNQTYNLTAVRDAARMVTHHLLDALAVLPHLPDRKALKLLDVGSGGGVPGIPLAIARPEWSVTLLDSNHKKGAFLRQAVAELQLANVEVVIERVEQHHPSTPYDAIISRAFSDLASFARCAASLLAPGGRLYAMKGVVPHEELGELPPGIAVVGMPAVAVPGLAADRHLVVLEPQ